MHLTGSIYNGGPEYLGEGYGFRYYGDTQHPFQLLSGAALSVGYTYSGAATPSSGLLVAGSVGVGTQSPAQALDVNGSINIEAGGNLDQQNSTVLRLSDNVNTVINPPSGSGSTYINWDRANGNTIYFENGSNYITGGGNWNMSGKLTVGTVDPLYTINGTNYATYVSGMTGQKEETSGVTDLSCSNNVCSSTIDFTANEGSDPWLFAEATNLKDNMAQMVVLLTPSFDGTVWYEKDVHNMTLTIYGDEAGEVSYRLTAPRFDASKWTNLSNETSTKGFIIND
jgi:hypothetical protein